MEHRRVGRVVIAAEGAAGHDDADAAASAPAWCGSAPARYGCAAACGCRRPAAGEIEGVLLLPRRMLGRDVERGEIVEIVLDMRALGDGEAHLAEDRDQLVDGLADRMDAALALGLHRQGDVDALGRRAARRARRSSRRARGLGERRLDLVLEAVERGAAARAAASGASAPSPFISSVMLPLRPERADAHLLERIAARRLLDEAEDLVADLIEAVHPPSAHRKRGRRGPSRLADRASGPSVSSPLLNRAAHQALSASAACACATIALKASGSRAARSASTLRSSSMPARFSPLMNCE